MRNLLVAFIFSACTLSVFGQPAPSTDYIDPSQVATFYMENLIPNPIKPAGVRVSNVEFQSILDRFASSSMLLDQNGNIVWRYTTPKNTAGNSGSMFNFYRVNDTTVVVYEFSDNGGHYYILNNDYSLRDVVWVSGVDRTRPHELIILPNGNYLLMGEKWDFVEPQYIRIEVRSGDTTTANSRMENIVIQEVTPITHQIVNEWWQLDHIDPITEWDTTKIPDATNIKVTHLNSIDYFYLNGELTLLVSGQASNTLYLIRWSDGQIIGRIGGRNSNFIFVPPLYVVDSLELYGQHYAKIQSWDSFPKVLTIAVFNNRYHESKAEGLILRVNLTNKTVQKNAAFTSNLFSPQIGSIDPYGDNWLVNWGRTGTHVKATGYNRFGVKQFNASFADSCDSYRIQPISQSEMDSLEVKRPSITQSGCMLVSSAPGYWQDGTTFGDTFVATQPDTFFIETEYGIGLIRSHEFVVLDTANNCGTTSIAQIEREKVILNVYPNPATNKVYLEASKGVLSVYSLTGALVLEKSVTDNSVEMIDITDFAKGEYVVSIVTTNGVRMTRTLIVH